MVVWSLSQSGMTRLWMPLSPPVKSYHSKAMVKSSWEREQAEVEAHRPQRDQAGDEAKGSSDEGSCKEAVDRVLVIVVGDDRDRVGADSVVGGVREGDHPGVAEHEVEAGCPEAEDEGLAGQEDREPGADAVGERVLRDLGEVGHQQDGHGKQGGQAPADAVAAGAGEESSQAVHRSYCSARPKRPQGRIVSTITMAAKTNAIA